MRSLALANQKGGVGKTTTAVHLAHGLAIAGLTVALFDLDPQGNATVALSGMTNEQDPPGKAPFDLLVPVAPRFWLLPSPGATRNLGRDVKPDITKLQQLFEALRSKRVDWILADCPPRMDDWGWAGLRLCEQVLIPVQTEFFAMHGLSQMLRTLQQAEKEFGGKAGLLGVLGTMMDPREPIARDVLGDLRQNLSSKVLTSVIHRDSQLVEAASHGVTVFEYNVSAKGARDYAELVREVVYG